MDQSIKNEEVRGTGDITKEYTVWCGLCSEWHQESSRTLIRFESIVRGRGWKKTKVCGWVGPNDFNYQ